MRTYGWLAAVMLGSMGVAFGQATDAGFDELMEARAAKWQELASSGNLTMETVTALNRDLLQKLDTSSLTLDQIETMAQQRAFLGVSDIGAIRETLETKSALETAEGVRATLLLAQVSGEGLGAERMAELLEHPGIEEVVGSPMGAPLMQTLASEVGSMTPEQRESVYRFLASLPADASDETLMTSRSLVTSLADVVEKEQLEMHKGAVARVRTIAAERATSTDNPMLASGLEGLVDFLAGSYAQGTLIGSQMPRMDITWSSEESLTSFDSLRGKVIVLDFWATWCGPCVAEMPHMKELYAQYKDKGVEFIGVSLDYPEDHPRGSGLEKLRTYVDENDIGWPQYYQGNYWQSDFSTGWGINSIPAIFVVDTEGNLHSTNARGKLDTMIPELLGIEGAG